MTLAQQQDLQAPPPPSNPSPPAAQAGRRSVVAPFVALARIAVRTLRSTENRVLHRRRYAAARQEIARVAPLGSALFICHGNICRSPFAAAVFTSLARQSLAANISVSSAGFIGADRGSPPPALAAAARRGYDMKEHRSTLITASALAASDLIVVMTANQAAAVRKRSPQATGAVIVLGDLDPLSTGERTIQDPWGRDDAVFDESFARVERCIGELVRVLVDAVTIPRASA